MPVPPGYTGDIKIRLVNEGFDNNELLDFCGMSIVKTGGNLPCVDIANDLTIEVPEAVMDVDYKDIKDR